MLHVVKTTILILASMTLVESCTTDPVTPNTQNLVVPGDADWRVTWYWDKDKDETSDFAQYTFNFGSNAVFKAEGNGAITTGTWQITSNDGTQRLVLSVSDNKPLSSLNDNWVILESGEQMIRLRDDNVTHLEELNFERVQ